MAVALKPLQTDVEATLESARALCRCLIGDRAVISPAERSTSPRGYGDGATLIMGVVAPVITAVLAVPRSRFFNVKALMAVEIGSLAVALINLT